MTTHTSKYVQISRNVRVRRDGVASITENPVGVETIGGTWYPVEYFSTAAELEAALA